MRARMWPARPTPAGRCSSKPCVQDAIFSDPHLMQSAGRRDFSHVSSNARSLNVARVDVVDARAYSIWRMIILSKWSVATCAIFCGAGMLLARRLGLGRCCAGVNKTLQRLSGVCYSLSAAQWLSQRGAETRSASFWWDELLMRCSVHERGCLCAFTVCGDSPITRVR